MINKIKIKGVACYREIATFETDKHVNLIYGLNGSGKSTFSEFLRNHKDEKYSECSIEPAINDNEEEILVYNEHYVEEIFYNSNKQPGIFSLSKENKEAKKAIEKALEEQKELQRQILKQQQELGNLQQTWTQKRQNYIDRIWNVQRDYTGGDRLLDYCFAGVRRPKELLFNHVCDYPKPLETPNYTIESLKQQVKLLNAASGTLIADLPEIVAPLSEIESNPIFLQVVTGNSGSYVAELINKIHNSDWVKEGLTFQTDGVCPFCQRPYDNPSIINDLKTFFDKAFEETLDMLKNMYNAYRAFVDDLRPNTAFDDIEIIQELKQNYIQAYTAYVSELSENIRLISNKIKNPSKTIQLLSTEKSLQQHNAIISQANQIIRDFNKKIATKETELTKIKNLFWAYIRESYHQTIIDYKNELKAFNTQEKSYKNNIETLNQQIQQKKDIIIEQQKNIIYNRQIKKSAFAK